MGSLVVTRAASHTPVVSTHMETLGAVLLLAAGSQAGLLGAGAGDGSCGAVPYRAVTVQWVAGCPEYASCCSEYGYCRAREEWQAGGFRDCNGESNATPLPADTIIAELTAAAHGDRRGLNTLGISVPPVGSIIGEIAVGTGGGNVILGGSHGSKHSGAGTPGGGAVSGGPGSGIGGAGAYGGRGSGIGGGLALNSGTPFYYSAVGLGSSLFKSGATHPLGRPPAS